MKLADVLRGSAKLCNEQPLELNLMAEGDDGAEGFMLKFIQMVAKDVPDFATKLAA